MKSLNFADTKVLFLLSLFCTWSYSSESVDIEDAYVMDGAIMSISNILFFLFCGIICLGTTIRVCCCCCFPVNTIVTTKRNFSLWKKRVEYLKRSAQNFCRSSDTNDTNEDAIPDIPSINSSERDFSYHRQNNSFEDVALESLLGRGIINIDEESEGEGDNNEDHDVANEENTESNESDSSTKKPKKLFCSWSYHISLLGKRSESRFLMLWHFVTALFSLLLIVENFNSSGMTQNTCYVVGTIEQFLIILQIQYPLYFALFDPLESVIMEYCCFLCCLFFIPSDTVMNLLCICFHDLQDSENNTDEPIEGRKKIYDSIRRCLTLEFKEDTICCRWITKFILEGIVNVIIVIIAIIFAAAAVSFMEPSGNKWCWIVGFTPQVFLFYLWCWLVAIALLVISIWKILHKAFRNFLFSSVGWKTNDWKLTDFSLIIYSFLFIVFWIIPTTHRIVEASQGGPHPVLAIAQDLSMGLYASANLLTSIIMIVLHTILVYTEDLKYLYGHMRSEISGRMEIFGNEMEQRIDNRFREIVHESSEEEDDDNEEEEEEIVVENVDNNNDGSN